MSAAKSAVYELDGFVLDLRRGALLTGDGAECPLRAKSFTLLLYLVENAGRLISRDEIMQAVWPDTFVTEDSITQCVREIRRALGDEGQAVLRTLPRRGYLLAGAVKCLDPGSSPAVAPPSQLKPQPLPLPATGRPMVIVHPLAAIGGDPEQDYFADGLTADLVTDLTRFQDLHIVSSPTASTSTGEPRDQNSDEAPRARYIVDGSVRRAGGRIRVTMQLKDARTDLSLWAERFDRPLEDLFEVQEELTNRIASLVSLKVGREGLRRARRQPPANLDAYDLYLQGRELHGRATESDTLLARRMFVPPVPPIATATAMVGRSSLTE